MVYCDSPKKISYKDLLIEAVARVDCIDRGIPASSVLMQGLTIKQCGRHNRTMFFMSTAANRSPINITVIESFGEMDFIYSCFVTSTK